ncbi:MAG TPA: heparinase II/III family protein, partial [Sphingomicrobium sp.]
MIGAAQASASPEPQPVTGARLVVEALEREGVKHVFGYPGGAIMPVYDALTGSSLQHILVRHEQAAALAADAYGRVTGRPGVCIATSGPGATNLVTGIANAFLDSVPVVAITGQVASPLMGVAFGIGPEVEHDDVGLARALATAQFDDGGLISRSTYEQIQLVDRFGLLRACYLAAKQTIPDGIEAAAQASLAALHGVMMGDGSLSSWQGCGPGESARLTALIDGCGLRARPLRQARGWGYQRMSALGTVLVIDAAPPPPQKVAEQGSASTLAFELSDGSQRLVVNCGGPGPLPTALPDELVQGLRTTAAHSTLVLSDTNSTNILADGSLGKGVEDVTIDRSEDNDASRLEASHDGYVRAFGLVHKRSLMLGNDGKELRGADQLIAKGRKKIKEGAPYAVRFHLAPGVEATITADGMGAILRSKGAPAWNFRCRGGNLTSEES